MEQVSVLAETVRVPGRGARDGVGPRLNRSSSVQLRRGRCALGRTVSQTVRLQRWVRRVVRRGRRDGRAGREVQSSRDRRGRAVHPHEHEERQNVRARRPFACGRGRAISSTLANQAGCLSRIPRRAREQRTALFTWRQMCVARGLPFFVRARRYRDGVERRHPVKQPLCGNRRVCASQWALKGRLSAIHFALCANALSGVCVR